MTNFSIRRYQPELLIGTLKTVTMFLLGVFLASLAIASAEVVTSNVFSRSGSSFVSSGSEVDGKYFGQWTVGDLTCYVAQDKVNGGSAVVKQCRRGLLGLFHPMTPEEEAIIEEEIKKSEVEKAAINERIAESNAVMQESMRAMHSQIQRNMEGMSNMMSSMQQYMQDRMQAAFGAFG